MERAILPPTVRFWRHVDKSGDCWMWTARLSDGYGRFWTGKGGHDIQAHRFSYEEMVGPIPAGLQLDHLCRTRACVNPAHLEPVTQRENILRGTGLSAVNARKTHCIRGHEFTPENTSFPRSGERGCKECVRVTRGYQTANPQRPQSLRELKKEFGREPLRAVK